MVSLSDFAAFSFLFQIFYSSATFFTSIILSFFDFFFFSLFFLFLLLTFFFSFLFFLLLLTLQFFLLWFLLLSILFWTPCYFYLPCSLVNFKIVARKPQYFQNHTSILTTDHINCCSFPMSPIIDIYLHYMLNRFFLVKETVHIYESFYFL